MKYLVTLIWIGCLLSLNSCNDEVCSDLGTRSNFLGLYIGEQVCGNNDPETTSLEITTAPDGARYLIVDNFLKAEITDEDSFVISVQTINFQGVDLEAEGQGSITGNNITLTYSIKTPDGTVNVCQFTGTK